MPDITRDEVAHLAMLARIELDDGELDRLRSELPAILEHVATVQRAVHSTSGDEEVTPMSHPLPMSNVFRPDEVIESLTPEAALAGAPDSDQQRFSVPRILEEE